MSEINNLIQEFISKTKLEEKEDEDMSEFSNGDIIFEDENYIEIYSNFVDNKKIKLDKNYSENSIYTLKKFLKTVGIRTSGKLKKRLILDIQEYFERLYKMYDDESDNESEDDEENHEDISEEQVREVLDKIFISWEYTKKGEIMGKMKRNVLEYFLTYKINKKLSKFEKEGYPVKFNTENRDDEFIEITYQDADKFDKQVKVIKQPITAYENIEF